MELGIVTGIGLLGYLLNQKDKETKFTEENNVELKNYVKSHPFVNLTNTYPQQRACSDAFPVYSPSYVKHQQDLMSAGLSRSTGVSRPTGISQSSGVSQSTGISQSRPNNQQQHNHNHNQNHRDHKEHFTNESDFIPSNDPTNDLLLDLKERPITDFIHNNMVPFYGAETKQNMAGTGIPSGNYIDGEDVNTGYDQSTPNQTLLSVFTGIDDNYMHKRETGPFFSPAETQTGWVYGSPLIRPDDDRFTPSLSNIRNDLKPVEAIQVGPGLNLDPSVPATGGFHEFTRILPNNVTDYKANQLEGRVIQGKMFSSGLPTSYPGIGTSSDSTAPGINKNRPNSFWDQSRLPTMTTRVAFQTNLDYNIADYAADFKPNNAMRDQTSFGLGNVSSELIKKELFQNDGSTDTVEVPCVNNEVTIGQGPLGAHIPQTTARSETFMSLDNNIRSTADCNSVPLGGPSRPAMGQMGILSNWYVNETDRGTVAPTNIEQINLNRQGQGSTFWTYEDVPNITTKETIQFAYSGNPSREEQASTFWNYNDVPDVTTKETTQYSHVGNPERQDQGSTFWTYSDNPDVTTKETTQYSHVGNPVKLGDAMMSRQQFTGFEVDLDDIS
jgi:hypothetical protein